LVNKKGPLIGAFQSSLNFWCYSSSGGGTGAGAPGSSVSGVTSGSAGGGTGAGAPGSSKGVTTSSGFPIILLF